jgi:hypothetical protein
MGINEDVYEVEESAVGDFYVSMVLRNRCTNLRLELVIIRIIRPSPYDIPNIF